MLTRIRSRLTYANVMATIAVFLALGGATIAAVKLPKKSVGTKQLKNKAVSKEKLKNKAVSSKKLGDKAVGTAKIAGSAVTSSKIASNAVQTSDIGNEQVTRAKVADSAIPFLGTLRSGQELRGSFNIGGFDDGAGAGQTSNDGITFQFPLTNAPSFSQANVIDIAGGDPATANCGGLSGGNQQTPLATPGQLCVYITGKTHLAPASAVVIENVTRLGFGLAAASDDTIGQYLATGQWAVTAP
ncbi:MAG: hypothetical protein AABM29_08010 [Actinomycetota bacterium]